MRSSQAAVADGPGRRAPILEAALVVFANAARLEGAVDELAPIRVGIHADVGFVARHREVVRLMHDEGKRRGPRRRWIVDRHVKPMFERLLPLMRHLQKRGRLPKDLDLTHFAYALIGATDVIFHQAEECRCLTGADLTGPDVIAPHARAVEHLLLGPPRASAS